MGMHSQRVHLDDFPIVEFRKAQVQKVGRFAIGVLRRVIHDGTHRGAKRAARPQARREEVPSRRSAGFLKVVIAREATGRSVTDAAALLEQRHGFARKKAGSFMRDRKRLSTGSTSSPLRAVSPFPCRDRRRVRGKDRAASGRSRRAASGSRARRGTGC